MAKPIVETPLMKQYIEMKAKHPDAILLFRVGDFFETFSEDAIIASEILGITLTRRANGSAQHVELAGFPHHALDTYLPKLIRAGKRVAICEQLEDPKTTKKLVKRGITELVTPASPSVTISSTTGKTTFWERSTSGKAAAASPFWTSPPANSSPPKGVSTTSTSSSTASHPKSSCSKEGRKPSSNPDAACAPSSSNWTIGSSPRPAPATAC